MIVLNRFRRFDTVGLSHYLSDEAKLGHHILYVSRLFLIFKNELPKHYYYVVLPRPMKLKEDIVGTQLRTSIDYVIYETETVPNADNVKLEKEPMTLNWWMLLFLIIMPILSSGFYQFSLANCGYVLSRVGVLILFIMMGVVQYYYEREKKKKRLFKKEPRRTSKVIPILDYIGFFILFLTFSLLVFGFSYRVILFLLAAFFFLFIPIREYVFWCLFVSLALWVMVLLPSTTVDSIRVEDYFPIQITNETIQQGQTGFVPEYVEYSASQKVGDTWKSIRYTYYRTIGDYAFNQLKHDMRYHRENSREIEVEGFERVLVKEKIDYQKVDVEGLEEVYQKEAAITEYYFESNHQILIITPMDDGDLIGFAKAKMKI
ncbi:hypothetical protein [Beduini massiliensis]|uniref:hypothetical protein n=1 Tax=Beduini massiliensis TaxID=1585974 RepID=UPI00059A9D57|nr:hypothetical protein [Beduini massiliensis]